jgi:hypothetical protein
MPQPAPFQYSIRELFLTITAVAACLTLVLQNVKHLVPMRGSELTANFSLQATIQELASKKGIKIGSGSGGSSSSGGPESYQTSSSYGFKIPSKDRAAIFKDFRDHIEAALSESRCKSDGGEFGSRSFSRRFHNDHLQGIVKAEMRDDSTNPEYVHITYFAVEFKK